MPSPAHIGTTIGNILQTGNITRGELLHKTSTIRTVSPQHQLRSGLTYHHNTILPTRGTCTYYHKFVSTSPSSSWIPRGNTLLLVAVPSLQKPARAPGLLSSTAQSIGMIGCQNSSSLQICN
ncbi:hypothetical protein Taro_041528 [Colocasia esculenta]|uniref:Uncharacterized protein n=1 Tax=Colocasia esculenta TaxID=4460 RepID=A0A843WTU1_COLES|nr:hypothetical protein [Colocasia esculenta]